MSEQTLFEEHENMESGCSWRSSYTTIKLEDGTEADAFSGLECECGAFINNDKLASMINHYYGNRINLSLIKNAISPQKPPRKL